jgi:hypothetical protein
MDKRLAKRHKRAVTRAKEKVKISEPDVRTQEQIEAARAASQPDMSRVSDSKLTGSTRSSRANFSSTKGSAAKTDA